MIVRIPAKIRRDPLLLFGIVYLVLLLLFAIFGPMVRNAQLRPEGQANFNSVLNPVGRPFEQGRVDKQRIVIEGEGAFRLKFKDETTAELSAESSSSAIQTALMDLEGIGIGGVSVNGNNPFTVRFNGPHLTGEQQPLLEVQASGPRVKVEDVTDRGFMRYPVLGTDEIGRDILARLAQGARISLVVGFVVQILGLMVGITVGVLGVYAPRWISTPLMRLTDAMFAFPDMLLAILIVSVVRPDMFEYLGPIGKMLPVIVALSFTAWPSIARLVRSQVASLKDREFVVAAKASGASTFYLATRHVLPQLAGILMAVSMIEVAGTILAESTLSFLGIGIQAPDPSWGSMINAARLNMSSHPITLLWPCLILSLTIFALNFVGDGLRAAFDPKNAKQ